MIADANERAASFREACPICHDEDCQGPDAHQLIRQMQPSDYCLEGASGFYANAVGELEAIGVPLPGDLEEGWYDGEFANEVLDELEGKAPEGFAIWTDADYWSLWRI